MRSFLDSLATFGLRVAVFCLAAFLLAIFYFRGMYLSLVRR
jgi:hypothetical protein